MIRQSLLFLVFSLPIYTGIQAVSASEAQQKAEIIAIQNSSSHSAQLEKTIIAAGNFKKLLSHLQIPFISVTQNILNFSTEDYPEIPEEALTLHTRAGTFRIWRNEVGIFVCKLENRASLQQAYKLIDREALARAQRIAKCLLLVSADGKPHLSISR